MSAQGASPDPAAPGDVAAARIAAARTTAPGARRWRWLQAMLAVTALLLALLPERDAPRAAAGIARGGGKVTLTGDGVALRGTITAGTLPHLAGTLALAMLLDGDRRIVLDLDSDGGNLATALRAAWMLRQAGRITRLQAWVGAEASCQSACGVLFAAAGSRTAAPSALFMFHAPRFSGRDADPLAAVRVTADAERRYMAALALADPPLVDALRTAGAFDAGAATWLSAAELARGGWSFVSSLRMAADASQ